MTAIVKGCQRHERSAQRALYDMFAPMSLGVCMRYVNDRDEAQDVMQDGWVRVFERIGQVRDPQTVGGWIYRLMVNVSLRHCQRGKLKPEVVDELPEVVQLPLDPFAMEEVVEAMGYLTNAQRLVFNLVEVEGYSYAEVAQKMRCSEVNVRALLSRAKSTLRNKLIAMQGETASHTIK